MLRPSAAVPRVVAPDVHVCISKRLGLSEDGVAFMKYGERLYSYSVPEWRTHNILYDELKLEIKDLTVSSASFSNSGYARLVDSFKEELQSVNLFTRCKLGEIKYRFKQCRDALNSPRDGSWQGTNDIHRLNQEIYNLSRYISAQYTGFKKLLKKYRRHAPEKELASGRDLQVIHKLIHDPDSFASVDLTRQFLDLSSLYLRLKAAAEGPTKSASSESRIKAHRSNSNAPLQAPNSTASTLPFKSSSHFASPLPTPAPSVETLLNFDVEMLTSFSDVYRFWVHDENLVQLKVQLLQYMDLVCSAEQSGSTTIDCFDNKELSGVSHQVAQLRTVRTREASTQSASTLFVPASGMRYMSTKISVEQAQRLQIGDVAGVVQECSNIDSQPALRWLSTRDCSHILKVRTECTRFKTKEGVWACIYSGISTDTRKFPHSVLEIRTHTDNCTWLESLRESHLLHAVPLSFSIYTWAVLANKPNLGVERTQWFDELEAGKDIKRVPEGVRTVRSARSARSMRSMPGSGNITSAKDDSIYDINNVYGDENNSRSQDESNTDNGFRYWNEFDAGELGEEHLFLNEIDEELRRARTAARLAQPVYQLGASMRRKLQNWFDYADTTIASSNSSYNDSNGDATSVTSAGSHFSGDSLDESGPLNRTAGGQYSPRISSRSAGRYGACLEGFNADLEARLHATARGQHKQNVFTRSHSDAALGIITFLCFCLSLAIVILVFTILLTEDLTLIAVGVRIALILFLLTALSLSLLGYVANNFRSDPGWLSQALVHTALLCVVCLGVGGIANVASPVL